MVFGDISLSEFEYQTFCTGEFTKLAQSNESAGIAEYSKILPIVCHLTKISMPYILSGKTEFSMASCYIKGR